MILFEVITYTILGKSPFLRSVDPCLLYWSASLCAAETRQTELLRAFGLDMVKVRPCERCDS